MSGNVPAPAGARKSASAGFVGPVQNKAQKKKEPGRSQASTVMETPLDSDKFVKLSRRDKLSRLLDAAGASSDAAQILGAPLAATHEAMPAELASAADQLLSVLSYVMRVGRYDSRHMRRVWTEQGTFRQAVEKERPPWASASLRLFLMDRGQSGLQDAVRWIRCH